MQYIQILSKPQTKLSLKANLNPAQQQTLDRWSWSGFHTIRTVHPSPQYRCKSRDVLVMLERNSLLMIDTCDDPAPLELTTETRFIELAKDGSFTTTQKKVERLQYNEKEPEPTPEPTVKKRKPRKTKTAA